MSVIRPEASAALWRWREVIAGALITALGANWAFTAYGVLAWVGWPVLLLGLALLVSGLQRARVRPRSGGAGVIELDERQLTYLHPDHGAIIALPAVARIEIVTTGAGPGQDDLFWVFTGADQQSVEIPASAVGAERLFDALAAFPGADYEKVIEASASTERHVYVIWQKNRPALH